MTTTRDGRSPSSPTTVSQKREALRAEKVHLTNEIRNIDAQLSQKRKYDADGRMWSAAEYHTWRARACAAKAHLQQRARRVKEELAAMSVDAHVEAAGLPAGATADDLLLAAYVLLRRLHAEEVEFDPSEFSLMDAMRDMLVAKGRRVR